MSFGLPRFYRDNLGYTPGGGAVVGSDTIGGVDYQRIKVITGSDGVNDGDVSDKNPLPAKAARVEDLLEVLVRLLKMSETLQVVDSSQRQRIVLDAITASLTLATVTTVGTVSNITTGTIATVSNLTANAGMDREQFINIAKQTYAQSIRANLKFQ